MDNGQHHLPCGLQVRGEGEWPRLKFDMRECILPAVPLGVRADAQFHVVNDGYDNLELKVCCHARVWSGGWTG